MIYNNNIQIFNNIYINMENLKNNKLTIITPSYRINNLIEIKKSLNFEYIDEWIIVYDGNKIK